MTAKPSLWRVLRTGLSSLRDRTAARFAASRINPSRVTVTRISSRPMTDEDWKRVDQAFAHVDAAFVEVDKAFKELGRIK
jgi:hypothetical protein